MSSERLDLLEVEEPRPLCDCRVLHTELGGGDGCDVGVCLGIGGGVEMILGVGIAVGVAVGVYKSTGGAALSLFSSIFHLRGGRSEISRE